MSVAAYYNEIDPFAAAWLRELIKAGHIAPGDVDERSIEDVRPDDLRGYVQCHFFAGIGVWSYALRLAGWPDSRPIWTGSCPCQPFSAAGKGGGFADERHLWPHFHYLIRECRPAIVAGEQVASKDGLAWLDLVQADMEGTDYAFGAVDTCSAGFGAPHIRQRLHWLAEGLAQPEYSGREAWQPKWRGASSALSPGSVDRLADIDLARLEGRLGAAERAAELTARAGGVAGRLVDADGRRTGAQPGDYSEAGEEAFRDVRPDDGSALRDRASAVGWMADHAGEGRRPEWANCDATNGAEAVRAGQAQLGRCGAIDRPGPTNGFWSSPDWLFCRDGKWRPVESGAFPLAHGAPARVGRLRGYGNAINAEAAVGFIEAYLDARG